MADERKSNFDKLTPQEKAQTEALVERNLNRAQHEGNQFALKNPEQYRANGLDSISIAKIEARADGQVLTARSGDLEVARSGDLHVSLSTNAYDTDAFIQEGSILNPEGYLSASKTGLVVGPKGITGNGKVAAQAIMAVKGVFNDSLVDAQEVGALKKFVSGVSGERRLDPDALATLKKFEGLAPEVRHAILAKAGQLAGKENLAGYADAALAIAKHFNPDRKDLDKALADAACEVTSPKVPVPSLPDPDGPLRG